MHGKTIHLIHIKFILRQSLRLSKFFVTVYVIKGANSIPYPRKAVPEPYKCIWSASFADIKEQILSAEKGNIKLRFAFQTEDEPNYAWKSYGDKSVPTISYPNENDSLKKLSDDFDKLYNGAGGTEYDIELKSGDLVRGFHKNVLSVRSEFFEKNPQSLTKKQVELPRMDPTIFDEIGRHFYTGMDPDLTFETAGNICKVGDICNSGLRQRCMNFLIDNLSEENAWQCLTLTDDECFRERVIAYIIDNRIPHDGDAWKSFCDEHPKSANDVLRALVEKLLK